MLRFASVSASAAVLVNLAAGQMTGTDLEAYNDGMRHKKGVPPNDKCNVNCDALCEGSMPKDIHSIEATPKYYCKQACVSHSIATTMTGYTGLESRLNGQEQGMYIQMVMAEYCDNGLCSSGGKQGKQGKQGKHGKSGKLLLQHEADIQKHEQEEGEAWGYPAKPPPFPKGCHSISYYCTQYCENSYHEPTQPLGAHPGTYDDWSKNQGKCESNCAANWDQVVQPEFDSYCSCVSKDGAPSYPPQLLQEAAQTEQVDVGSFIQMPTEL